MPIARDVMTYLFDQQKAWDALLPLEAGWGGTPQQRQAAKYRSYAAQYGVRAPEVDSDDAIARQSEEAIKPAPQPIQSDAAPPAPEPQAEPTPAPPAPAAPGVTP